MGLQETKIEDDKFPIEPIAAAGYRSFYAGQKTYNGVAIVVRNIAAAPPKALQLKKALAAGSIGAQLVADAGVPEGGAMIWIGRRPVFMQANAKQ